MVVGNSAVNHTKCENTKVTVGRVLMHIVLNAAISMVDQQEFASIVTNGSYCSEGYRAYEYTKYIRLDFTA